MVHHRVQVTSFGGSGTTALADHLLAAGVDLPKTPGFFPFKHQRVPPPGSAVPTGFRVVYPFGDPRNAVCRCSGAGSRVATTAGCSSADRRPRWSSAS